MTADNYRKIVLLMASTLAVVAVIIPSALIMAQNSCKIRDGDCAWGLAILIIFNLGVAGFLILVSVAVLLFVSISRCKDVGISGFFAFFSVLLLLEVIGKAFQIWRRGEWGISPTSPIVSLLLSLAVVAASLTMLGKMRSGTLKDAETTKPLAFWPLWVSTIVITLAMIPGLLVIVTIATFFLGIPNGGEATVRALASFYVFVGPYWQAFMGAHWVAVAKIVFVASMLALMQMPQRPGNGSVPSRVISHSGRIFGRRQS